MYNTYHQVQIKCGQVGAKLGRPDCEPQCYMLQEGGKVMYFYNMEDDIVAVGVNLPHQASADWFAAYNRARAIIAELGLGTARNQTTTPPGYLLDAITIDGVSYQICAV